MKIIIVGSGRMGGGLALELQDYGHEVTVIDSSQEAFGRLGAAFRGRTLRGIGFDQAVLKEAGIETCDAIAAFTNNDEANAVVARMAREIFRVPKVVAGLIDIHKGDIYKKLGIQVISPGDWGIRRAVALLSYEPLHTVYTVGEGGVQIKVIDLPPLLAGRKVRELNSMGEYKVITITRNNQSMIPTEEDVFQQGDRVLLAVANESLERLKSLLGLR